MHFFTVRGGSIHEKKDIEITDEGFAGSGFATKIGEDAGDYEVFDLVFLEDFFEVSLVKGTVGIFSKDGFVGLGS